MLSTVRKIAVPGKIAQCGAKSRLSLASKRMRPQVGMSGGKPRPRNDRVDSARMAAATSSEPATMTGPRALGRIWRESRPGGGGPRARGRFHDLLLAQGENLRAHEALHGHPAQSSDDDHDHDEHARLGSED